MRSSKTGKKTEKYTTEFKVKAVEWSHQVHRSVKSVAKALDTHPMMLSRWRKEHREGKFAMKRVKRVPAEAKKKISEQDEIDRLKRQIAELQEENDILKKFQRFQAEERQKRSGSSGNTNGNTA
ncbi:transposase [Marinobacter salexigens]|uniref:transposase n=1 Tax=Marinobacter salexigens TaxID=1925763 RepID=UPI000C28B8FF|nr:transposase [Marinobacter salexigens]